jgi:hypothetical protein
MCSSSVRNSAHPIHANRNASSSIRVGTRVRASLSVRALSVRARVCLSVRALSVCACARVRACVSVRARARASVFCSNNAHVRRRASVIVVVVVAP